MKGNKQKELFLPVVVNYVYFEL